MRVAILGAGAAAFAAAALLVTNGHEPVLWSPSGKRTEALSRGETLLAEGVIEGAFRVDTARTVAEAVARADAVLIALPANGHRKVMDALAACAGPEQTVIINSHASFGILYLAQRFEAAGRSAPAIVAWSTTVTRSRQLDDRRVRINTLRRSVPAAVLPDEASGRALDVCRSLFGDRFEKRGDILEIALSNLNPQSHLALALCNFTRIEHAEDWAQNGSVTEGVGRLMETLDAERLAIAEACGVRVRSVQEHYMATHGLEAGSVHAMSQALHSRGSVTLGPKSASSRYVTEDVPFGLVPLVTLGHLVDRPAKVHESGLELFSAIYGRNFRVENDILPTLGLDALDGAELIGYLSGRSARGTPQPGSAAILRGNLPIAEGA